MTVPYEENPVTQMLKANRAADLSGWAFVLAIIRWVIVEDDCGGQGLFRRSKMYSFQPKASGPKQKNLKTKSRVTPPSPSKGVHPLLRCPGRDGWACRSLQLSGHCSWMGPQCGIKKLQAGILKLYTLKCLVFQRRLSFFAALERLLSHCVIVPVQEQEKFQGIYGNLITASMLPFCPPTPP